MNQKKKQTGRKKKIYNLICKLVEYARCFVGLIENTFINRIPPLAVQASSGSKHKHRILFIKQLQGGRN